MRKALTIAGSDCSGGAGIQADLKTFHSFGIYGMSVITALTAQNTTGVQGIYSVSADFVSKQIISIVNDIGCDVVKCGMLADADIVSVVAKLIKKYNLYPFVLDPVMFAKSGASLLDESALETLKKKLLPLSNVVTPNLKEASYLSGIEQITNPQEMAESAKIIKSLGAKNVLIKGGHLEGDTVVDILYDGEEFYHFSSQKIDTTHTHGTGCTYASAIASCLALGKSLVDSILTSKTYIYRAIKQAPSIGKGNGPLNHFVQTGV